MTAVELSIFGTDFWQTILFAKGLFKTKFSPPGMKSFQVAQWMRFAVYINLIAHLYLCTIATGHNYLLLSAHLSMM